MRASTELLGIAALTVAFSAQAGPLSVGSEFGIAPSAGSQSMPAVAYAGPNYLVVWQEGLDGGSWDIYGARIASDGGVLDANSIAISTAPMDQLAPQVAFDGVDYLVVWADGRWSTSLQATAVFGARVRVADGQLLDGPPDDGGFLIGADPAGEGYPSIACNSDCLVAWATSGPVRGTRITVTGALLDSDGGAGGLAISPGNPVGPTPIAAGTSTFFVAYQQTLPAGGGTRVEGARVRASDGTILDPLGILVGPLPGMLELPNPVVSFSNGLFLVVWTDDRYPYRWQTTLRGMRIIEADGGLLDGPASSNGIDVSDTPGDLGVTEGATFDGLNWVMAWADRRAETGISDVSTEIFAARMSPEDAGSPDGLADGGGVLVSTYTTQGQLGVVGDGNGNVLVVFDRDVGVPTMAISQIRGTFLCESGGCEASVLTDGGDAGRADAGAGQGNRSDSGVDAGGQEMRGSDAGAGVGGHRGGCGTGGLASLPTAFAALVMLALLCQRSRKPRPCP